MSRLPGPPHREDRWQAAPQRRRGEARRVEGIAEREGGREGGEDSRAGRDSELPAAFTLASWSALIGCQTDRQAHRRTETGQTGQAARRGRVAQQHREEGGASIPATSSSSSSKRMIGGRGHLPRNRGESNARG